MKAAPFFWVLFLLLSCTNQEKENKTVKEPVQLFKKRADLNILFSNNLKETERLNPYTYRNFYNGAGVALGDLNNDGLIDIYFGGNQVDNKLYINRGNWNFEDVTAKAGVACSDAWSSGITFIDINHDGYLDIYVCKAGPPSEQPNRHNELFINNGDLTFTEKSKEYGLDFVGLAVQASFFDYDKDGDLDCYLLNNSIKTVGAYDFIEDQRELPTSSGNKLLRNDDGVFVDVTTEAGIYSSSIGFGLGITVSDLNNDLWPDIFVSNDFFEKDYLYINQKDGSFSESITSQMQSISMGSMGADVADLDNDSNMDIMVTEMLPRTIERQRTKTIFESWNKYEIAVKKGYHHQFSRNALHRNLGNDKFVEVGRFSEVAASEWSWASLIFDADNDGIRDVFISNGIYKDLLDRDYLTYMANEDRIRDMIKSDKEVMNKLVDLMPSEPVSNVMYKNLGSFQFEEVAENWGLNEPSFSNGSAYADLDNDGDLDLVVNNVNMPAFIYENKSESTGLNSFTVSLKGIDKNIFAVGAKLEIYYGDDKYSVQENFPSRGFQSSVPYRLHFGLNTATSIDSMIVTWPNLERSTLKDLKANTHLEIDQSKVLSEKMDPMLIDLKNDVFEPITPLFLYKHQENMANDFNREQLLPEMYNNEGPHIAQADLNQDGHPDFYIGGAKGQSGILYISNNNGTYQSIDEPFKYDASSEDTDAVFFDSDNDGDMDLYVCSGGKSFSKFDFALNDRLYINDGKHNFTKNLQAITFKDLISTATVSVYDYDQDGDDDLFIGERFKVETYGIPSSGYILVNEGGNKFKQTLVQELENLGLITDSKWADLNDDGIKDLVVSGEWMPITVLINDGKNLVTKTKEYGLSETSGFWKTIEVKDLDSDGINEIIAGNKGRNSFFKKGTRMYIADFDKNGKQEQIICHKKDGKYFPILDRDELISQLAYLKRKLLYYKDYSTASIDNIFEEDILKEAIFFDIDLVETSIFKKKNKKYNPMVLPPEIQYSNVEAINATDINGDGYMDIILGGNQYLVKPQFGRQDASSGWLMTGNSNGTFNNPVSLNIEGQIRDFQTFPYKEELILMTAVNGDSLNFRKKITD